MIYAQLPPLNSIKAFDAVVRHGSISEASRVLYVSQSAVSRHIAKLEDFMGCQLLIRGKLGTVMTKEGEALFVAFVRDEKGGVHGCCAIIG